MKWFSFTLLISGGAVLGHLYLYRRLVRPMQVRRSVQLALGALLLFMTVFLLLRGPVRGIGPAVKHVHDLVAYSWIALAMSFLVATALGDAVRLGEAIARRLARRRGEQPGGSATASTEIDHGRRAIAHGLPVAVLAGGGITALYSSGLAFAPAEISEFPVLLPRLPRTLDGLTIVQLTDLHVGPFIGRRFVERLVGQANALAPDLVVITGDLVDGNVPTLGHAVSALGSLRARFGTFFVTGNHEYYSGVVPWTQFLIAGWRSETAAARSISSGSTTGAAAGGAVGATTWKRRCADATASTGRSCFRTSRATSKPPPRAASACRSPATPTAARSSP
jgi:uncharacterized protein